ncbi:hypothetical protein NDU88_003979 [Pleurodeles waltl]|uniref:Uncharacterized protein n=1 Tax=Pleurodeles waltl TaxID=8319 RepID=A0AAV7W6J0_PLEWA|nr:hypothetical protein NDU88_003979 [Pleurodeles waltl]
MSKAIIVCDDSLERVAKRGWSSTQIVALPADLRSFDSILLFCLIQRILEGCGHATGDTTTVAEQLGPWIALVEDQEVQCVWRAGRRSAAKWRHPVMTPEDGQSEETRGAFLPAD